MPDVSNVLVRFLILTVDASIQTPEPAARRFWQEAVSSERLAAKELQRPRVAEVRGRIELYIAYEDAMRTSEFPMNVRSRVPPNIR